MNNTEVIFSGPEELKQTIGHAPNNDLANIEIKFDHVKGNISVLRNNVSIIEFYNIKKSGNIFANLDYILCLLNKSYN